MRSTYKTEDVELLLKDITGLVEPKPTKERETLIQAGVHYCEMLPIEYVPTEKYMEAYREALEAYGASTAEAVRVLAEKVIKARGEKVVLVSLARAGIPIGILLKHYIQRRYRIVVPHYSISIIRGRGIDDNAMKYLLSRYDAGDLLFVDGWVGKGAILSQLREAVSAYEGVSAELAVLADPANVTELCGTHEDILIPSSCLNCTVSGLISRTFLRSDIIGPEDFHGAVYYGELKDADLSYDFIEHIEKYFDLKEKSDTEEDSECKERRNACDSSERGEKESISDQHGKNTGSGENEKMNGLGVEEVRKIAADFGIADINLVKPGIGETTRVLLRRVPYKVLIEEGGAKDPQMKHLLRLAKEKDVPVEEYPLKHYKCCGIIKKMADT